MPRTCSQLHTHTRGEAVGEVLKVIVPALPHISNHTDFDALRAHVQVDFSYVRARTTPPADLIVLPGSKSVQRDLAWLRENGWDRVIERYLRYGGKVLGICGGMQMLGRTVDDPQGVEGPAGCVNGLGLLDLDTTLTADKLLDDVTGRLTDVTGRLTLSRSAPSRLPCEATRSAWAARRAQRLLGRR